MCVYNSLNRTVASHIHVHCQRKRLANRSLEIMFSNIEHMLLIQRMAVQYLMKENVHVPHVASNAHADGARHADTEGTI